MSNITLEQFAHAFDRLTDPRSKQGTNIPLTGILALTFLGLLARKPYIAHIQRWAAHHWHILQKPLGFKNRRPPHATTLSRILAKITLAELQDAFAHFLNTLLGDQLSTLAVAVDGKTSKQVLDKDGEVLSMLNVFVHDLRMTLMEWSVKGDKTNEMGCLKQHLAELLRHYPQLKILTGDAAFAMRPLLEVLKEHKVDYVFQVKGNQPEVLEAVETTFAERENVKPAAEDCSKEYAKKNAA